MPVMTVSKQRVYKYSISLQLESNSLAHNE